MAKRVTEQEKEKMWLLYNECHSIQKVAKKTRRDRSTVSKYVREYEAAVRTASVILNAHNA